jgi:hypothetical protein
MRAFAIVYTALCACACLTGCVMVGASSSGGFFIWPGGLGLVVMVLLVIWMLRRR